MRLLIVISLLFYSQLCMGENVLDGLWKAGDKAGRSIYGFIKISGNDVKWGTDWDLNMTFPCSAKIKMISEEGEWEPSPENKRRSTKTFLFYLQDKQCDYKAVRNSEAHKEVEYFRFTFIIPYNKNYVNFIRYHENQKKVGKGSLHKQEQK